MHNIYCENCIEGAKDHILDESIDLLICDPPFGINEASFDKHYNRNSDVVLDGYVEAPEDYYTFSYQWLSEAMRVMKKDASMYVISGHTNLIHIENVIKELGFNLVNHIIWKYNFGVNTKNKFVTSHYHILYLTKDKKSNNKFNTYCRFGPQEKDIDGKSLLYKDLEDVWIINKEFSPGEKKNQNKLPNELVSKMILYSSDEGDSVCDFFLGNFTTAFVAYGLGRIPYGFEINKISYDENIKIFDDIEFGYKLKDLRDVPISIPSNSGKPISDLEKANIRFDFEKFSKIYKYKKEVIEALCLKYGRGRFSIYRILKD